MLQVVALSSRIMYLSWYLRIPSLVTILAELFLCAWRLDPTGRLLVATAVRNRGWEQEKARGGVGEPLRLAVLGEKLMWCNGEGREDSARLSGRTACAKVLEQGGTWPFQVLQASEDL